MTILGTLILTLVGVFAIIAALWMGQLRASGRLVDRYDLIHLRFRIERRLLLLPYLRLTACAVLIMGGLASLVSGLLFLDAPLKGALDFILGVFFLLLGAALWEME
jgi:hypothetical protein